MSRKSLEIGTPELNHVLKLLIENSEDLKMLLSEVNRISDRISDVCELSALKRVEEKMAFLENLIKALPQNSRGLQKDVEAETVEDADSGKDELDASETGDSTIVSECKSWNDFQAFAATAQSMYFSYQRNSQVFEAEALSGKRVITYSGQEPMLATLLKLWLRSQLEPQKREFLESTSI